MITWPLPAVAVMLPGAAGAETEELLVDDELTLLEVEVDELLDVAEDVLDSEDELEIDELLVVEDELVVEEMLDIDVELETESLLPPLHAASNHIHPMAASRRMKPNWRISENIWLHGSDSKN